jgi:hypothetical protein
MSCFSSVFRRCVDRRALCARFRRCYDAAGKVAVFIEEARLRFGPHGQARHG